VSSYDELFNGSGRQELTRVSQFGNKWGWYSSVYALAQQDIRRFEDITKLKMHECLLFLTFEKEKNEIEASQISKINSMQGIRGFYQLTETIKEQQLLNDVNVNTVTTGDITEIDLSKQTIFPLSHIIVNNVTAEEQYLGFNITVMSMDIVDESKEPTTDIFRGNNNEQDVLNTQLAVLNRLTMLLRKGNLHTDLYQLDGTPNCEPFYERFENRLAGWACTFDVFIQNDIDICS
jgi:hypothetical protein